MKRIFSCVAALSLLIFASALLARPGILKTKSGQTYNGEIKDDGDSYTVTVGKIDSQIPKTDVATVSYTGSIDDQFKDRLSKLDPKDAEGRVKLARFAFDNGRNDLAIQSLSAAMQIDHNNADAIDMLKTVRAQQQLEQNQAAGASNPPPSDIPTNPQAPASVVTSEKRLTDADINSIRQHEIMPGEEIPIQISPDLRRKMAARVGMTYDDFSAQAPTQQLQAILDKGDPDMKAAAKVGRDPLAILTFKREIQPMVLRNCATIGCHGGATGGSFILFNKNDTASTYTNFYIMEQFSMKTAATGFFGSGDRKMIERGDGIHSLLIAYGLPAGQADVSHPKVPNSSFNGMFRSAEDRLAQQAIQWMNHGLNTIEPNYGISFSPPMGATTQPTTAP